MSNPLDARASLGTRKLNTTLRDLTDWLYPNGWNRKRDLPRIRRALLEVNNFTVEYERREWFVVQALALPNDKTRLDDPIPFNVNLPFESDRGALIDRTALRLFGVRSAPAYRAWLRLAYLWDSAKTKNGGYRIYATRPRVMRNERGYLTDKQGRVIAGPDPARPFASRRRVPNDKPVQNWTDSRAVLLGDDEPTPERTRARVPVLDNLGLVRLCFDDADIDHGQLSSRLYLARRVLRQMEQEGAIAIEELPNGWRILEPRPGGQTQKLVNR